MTQLLGKMFWGFVLLSIYCSSSISSVQSPPFALRQLINQYKIQIEQAQDAVVLKKYAQIYIHNKSQVEGHFYSAIAVKSTQAVANYTQISISFNSFYEEIELEFARIIDASGGMHSLSPDAVQIQTQSRSATYDDIRQLVFSLPRLEVNAVFEFKYRISVKKAMVDNAWFDRISFQKVHYTNGGNSIRVDPVLDAEIVVNAPQGLDLQHAVKNAVLHPQINYLRGRAVYQWRLQAMPRIHIEPAMRPLAELIPFLEISTIQSWGQVDAWAKRYYLHEWTIERTIEDLNRVSENNLLTVREQVQSAYYYLQDRVRYIEADFARGGIIPHKPVQVLQKRYGDCKDQAVLLSSLLRFQGIKAYPALVTVYPNSNILDEVPSLNFSHAIVYVEDERGKSFFVDTSGNTGLFPGIDWSLEGARAFVVDGNGGKLVSIPRRLPEENSINIFVHYNFKAPHVQVHFEMDASGTIGNRYKAWLDSNSASQEEVAEVLEHVFSGADIAELEVKNVGRPRQPAKIIARILYKNTFQKIQEKINLEGSLGVLVRSFTGTLPLVDPDKRLNDFYVNVPYKINYKVNIDNPSLHHKGVIMQSGGGVDDTLLSLIQQHKNTQHGIELNYAFTLQSGKIEKRQYPRFYRSFESALLESQWLITYLFDEGGYQRTRLESLVREGEDAEVLIKLAKHHLEMGEYEDAMTIGKRTVKLYPNDADAYYLLGISYGFMDQYEQSDRAIEKAKSLGYRP